MNFYYRLKLGIKKSGPVKKFGLGIAIIGILLAIIFFVCSQFRGASIKGQKQTHDKLDEVNQKVSEAIGEDFSRDEVVKKSLEEREKELKESLVLLKDALIKVQEGDTNYLKIMAGQLRALVCSGSISLNPLLLNLADEKKVSLKCYAPPIDELLEHLSKPVLLIGPQYIVLPEHAPGLKLFEFKKWLNSPYLVLTGDKYTPNEVIRMVAEKEGGVRYDNALPEKLIKLKGIIYSEKYNETEKLLVQVSVVVISFGELLLSENKN